MVIIREYKTMPRTNAKVTAEQRQMVEAMSGFGITHEDIAKVVINPQTGKPFNTETLRKHFRHELDTGHVKANAKVAKSLFELATVDRNVTAAIFWLKTRARWQEVVRTEHTGKDGAALPSIDPMSMTDAQIDSLATRVAIAAGIVEVVRGAPARERETPQSRDGKVH